LITETSFSDRYPRVELGQVVDFLDYRRRPITASDRIPGPYPYYGANGQQDSVADYIFEEPLILLAEDGGHFDHPDRGIAYTISGKTWVNNHAHVLRPRDGLDIRYLCRVLENYDVRPFVAGTTRSKLTKAGASRIIVPMAPLAEQRRIAAILDQADALRTQRRTAMAMANLDELVESSFEQFLDHDDSSTRTTIEYVGDVQSGLTVNRSRSNAPIEVPYLRVANVLRGRLDLSEVKMLGASVTETNRTALRRNDLLVVEGHGNPEEIGRVALWDGSVNPCVHQNHLIRIRFDESKILPDFACSYLNSVTGRRYLLRSAKTTSGLNTMNVSQVRSTPLIIPSLPIQQRFSHLFSAIQRLKATHYAALTELDALFESLQHLAFRGEL
jgi:type I restriction enzyme S subunit